jgi:hypothetical protein
MTLSLERREYLRQFTQRVVDYLSGVGEPVYGLDVFMELGEMVRTGNPIGVDQFAYLLDQVDSKYRRNPHIREIKEDASAFFNLRTALLASRAPVVEFPLVNDSERDLHE